jgi:MoxR-vWA-beta-propeller ternary system domain bpX1/MoxR-vWA-beta-propeller ternary system domain bpX0
MIKAVTNTQHYFQAPLNYFWQWAEGGDFIEWKNGITICHRNELVLILKEAAIPASAPLGTILLLLSATLDSYTDSEVAGILLGILKSMPKGSNEPNDEEIEESIRKALAFLDVVVRLPKELRERKQSARLLQEVFSSQNFVMKGASLREAADELNSGRIDHLIFPPGEKITRTKCLIELNPLIEAGRLFPNPGSLELRLRAGVYHLPEPVKIDIPEPISGDLFDQLSDDPKTASLVRLAKHIVAALKIPMHSQGSGDQSYGGISDITNRGNYDKLLLSELAHDDLLLMARLVNNEALYFRREEPPDNPKRQRTILLDSTLKMWGMPRVFALSASLACVKNSKHGELIEAYVLGGSKYKETGLDSKENIIKTLETLDPAMHCGVSLEAIIKDIPASEQNEYILITDEQSINEPSFQRSFSTVKDSLNYLLFVSRTGKLEFFSCSNGRTKLLSTAKFDLEKILFFSDDKKQNRTEASDQLPIFIQQDVAPLYYPIVRVNTSYQKCYSTKDIGTILVNETNRVLFRGDEYKAVKELLSYVEDGNYCFGFGSDDLAFLMVQKQQQQELWVYSFDLKNGRLLKSKHIEDCFFSDVIYDNGCFHIKRRDQNYYSFNCVTWQMSDYSMLEFVNVLKREEAKKGLSSNIFYKVSADNILTKLSYISIDHSNRICFGNFHINQIDKNVIKLSAVSTKERSLYKAVVCENDYRPLANKRIRFSKFIWDDGSEAVVDTRGFLHLRSSDKNIPEITIAMVINKSTACWSSDGFIAGSAYFYPSTTRNIISAEQFYNNYFQPFINRIISA